jgi:hypothetical protein
VAAVLTIASSGLAVLALLEPTWIERLFGVDPDTRKCYRIRREREGLP